MAQHAHRQSLQCVGVSQWNQRGLLASLYSVPQTHVQNTILVAMDLTSLERLVLDEWCYIPFMLLVAVNSFGLGLVMGFTWAYL